jgi:hypothetical protein
MFCTSTSSPEETDFTQEEKIKWSKGHLFAIKNSN